MSAELVDLELSAPGPAPDVSIRHARIRFVVRLDGRPLAVIDRPYAGHDLDLGAVAREVVAGLGSRVWSEVAWPVDRSGLDRVQGPRVTVAVCTRDRPAQLEGCLEALQRQRYENFEVLVVDNAPRSDETRRVAERWAVRRVVEPRPGLDWARNRGLAESKSPIVAYTDDDARPEPDWVESVAYGFGSHDVAVVTGLVLPAELETRAQMLFEDGYGGMGKGFELRVFSRRGRRPEYQPESFGVGCNMAFRREALERVGGFDPALDVGTATGGGGDLDVFQRIVEAGGVIVYRPDAVVRHVHRRSLRALRRQLFDNGRSYSAMLTAAFLRAHGGERLRVVARYGRWLWSWHLARIARRLVRRERLPLRLLLAEAAGAPLGPLLYARARRAAAALQHAPAEPPR